MACTSTARAPPSPPIATSPLVSVTVTPANSTMNVGATQQFSATGLYQNGSTSNITASVAWSSSNAAVATINSAGLTTGAGGGVASISATLSGITGSTSVNVQATTGCPCSIWSASAVPAVIDGGPDSPVELGVKFRADSDGLVTG